MQEVVANLQVSCATVQCSPGALALKSIAGPGTPGGLPPLVPKCQELFLKFSLPTWKGSVQGQGDKAEV